LSADHNRYLPVPSVELFCQNRNIGLKLSPGGCAPTLSISGIRPESAALSAVLEAASGEVHNDIPK